MLCIQRIDKNDKQDTLHLVKTIVQKIGDSSERYRVTGYRSLACVFAVRWSSSAIRESCVDTSRIDSQTPNSCICASESLVSLLLTHSIHPHLNLCIRFSSLNNSPSFPHRHQPQAWSVNAASHVASCFFANSHVKTSIGTGYDLSNSVFSPDGRNFQVSSSTLILVKPSTDGRLGRIRHEGSRERRYLRWYQMSRWCCSGSGETRHLQVVEEGCKQEDSHCRSQHWCCTFNFHPTYDIFQLMLVSRFLLVFSPMVATSSLALAMRPHHGALSTSSPSPSPPSPTAWDHTSKPTPSTHQSAPSASPPSSVVGTRSSKCPLMHRSVPVRQVAVAARCPTQRRVAHTST